MKRAATNERMELTAGNLPEVTVPAGRVYLSVTELAIKTGWSERQVWRLVEIGTLKRGTHWFQPFGRHSRIKFKWSAIELLIEGQQPEEKPAPRKARGGKVDVSAAQAELQRMLS